MGKKELVALLNLSSWCLVMVEWPFLAVPWGCLRFVIVVFPDQTHYFWSGNLYTASFRVCTLELSLDGILSTMQYVTYISLYFQRSQFQQIKASWKKNFKRLKSPQKFVSISIHCKVIWAVTCYYQQCGILTCVDSDEPVQSPLRRRNSKWCPVSSLTVIEYSSDKQRLWSDCAYAQADLRICWSHIPHCWKSHALAHFMFSVTHDFCIQRVCWLWLRPVGQR